MRGAARFDLRNERQLLGQPELRAAFRGHGVRCAHVREWNDLVGERCVQWVRHVHRRRDAKLRSLCLFRRDRTVREQLHHQFGLRAGIRLFRWRLQEIAGRALLHRRRVRLGILHRRRVLFRPLRRIVREMQSGRTAGFL